MKPVNFTLLWTNLAKSELEQFRNFSRKRWGNTVAKTNLADLRDAARTAAAELSRLRPLHPPLHIIRLHSHCPITHLDPNSQTLTIARILHTSMDIERHLSQN